MNNKIIAVVGANGKMGSLLTKKLCSDYCIIKITEDNSLYNYKNIDLVVDFANANSSIKSTKYCSQNKIPILIASTGQTKQELEEIKSFSSKIPIMICQNLSLGIGILKQMILPILNQKNIDITILEKHHKEKKDKPSGTAKMLHDFILKKTNTTAEIISERGGKEVGQHTIDFYFGNELISITHQAYSREIYVDGAILAIKFLLNDLSPRIYNFDEILNL